MAGIETSADAWIPAVYTIAPVELLKNELALAFPRTARFAGNLFLIARKGSEAVCAAAFRTVGPDEWELLFIETAAGHRRRGAATALVAELQKRCPGAIFLEVREGNHAAIALYHAAGFREIGIRQNYYSEPDESAIVMKFHS